MRNSPSSQMASAAETNIIGIGGEKGLTSQVKLFSPGILQCTRAPEQCVVKRYLQSAALPTGDLDNRRQRYHVLVSWSCVHAHAFCHDIESQTCGCDL